MPEKPCKEGGGGRRPPRVRTKAIRSLLVAQLEKLFCHGGLQRNGKLKGLIKDTPQGYVDLKLIGEIFGVKTGALSTKALKVLGDQSSVFEISENGLQVRQRHDVASSEECTIFIDNLPPEADETWLIENFERFGTVARAEVPKPRGPVSSRMRNRGFGFVEFVSVNASSIARKSFSRTAEQDSYEPNPLVPEPSTSADTLEHKPEIGGQKSQEECYSGKNPHLPTPSTPSSPTKSELLSPTGSDKTISPGIGRSKRKRKSLETDSSKLTDNEQISPHKSKRKRMESESNASSATDSASENRNKPFDASKKISIPASIGRKKKTRRKRTHQRKVRSIHDTKAKSRREKQLKSFLVLSLKEWKELKREYLRLQKANMSQTKELIKSHHIPIKLTPEQERNIRGRKKVEMKASLTIERGLNL